MNGKAPARVLISHQGCVPIYRSRLFERLAQVRHTDYVVAYGNPPRGTDYLTAAGPYNFKTLKIANHELPFGARSIIWQPLVRRFWKDFDAAILGDEVKFLSHIAIIAAAKLRGKPVVLWGFGDWPDSSKYKETSARGRLIERIRGGLRRALLKSVDGYLAYTERRAAILASAGPPDLQVATVYNTVDIEQQERFRGVAHASSDAECRSLLGVPPEGPVLLYFGRFTAWKRLDLLVDYAHRAKAGGRQLTVMFCGAGRQRDTLEAQAAGLDNVVFHTAPDDLTLARALRIASAVVIPGHVGLAITHCFAHGVPLLTRDIPDHPPEIEYLAAGENGLMLPREPAAFFGGIDAFLDDAGLQQRLRQGALASASRLSMNTMVAAFDTLVRDLLIAARFKAADRNRNGLLEGPELEAFRAVMAKIDTDNDGRISREEFFTAAKNGFIA